MLRRLSNSWALAKASAAVLRADKELVIFPLLSAFMLVVVSAGFVLPFVFAGEARARTLLDGPLAYGLGFLFYLVSYFVIFFCNSALVGAAMIRLRGGDPTVGDGFRIAWGKAGTILGYAFVAATVGMILRQLQERAGLIGRIVVSLIGVAWNVATFLVVPVLVSESVGPIDAVKRSSQLLKKTWGEQVVGNFTIGSITGLAAVVLLLLFTPLAILVGSSGSTPALIAVGAACVLCLMALALINATLAGIYTAAVYRYAAEGEIGMGFDSEMVKGAFRPK